MRRLLVIFALLGVVVGLAQTDLPPLPLEASANPLMLPGALRGGLIAETERRYLLLAAKGDTLTITMQRTSGDLIPLVTLQTLDGEPLAEAFAEDVSGRVAELHYDVPMTAWYEVIADRDRVAAPNSSGTYFIEMTGGTDQLFDLLRIAAPPDVEGTRVFLGGAMAGRGQEALRFLVPLLQGEKLVFTDMQNVAVEVLSLAGEPLDPADYVSSAGEWVQVIITPGAEAMYMLNMDIHHADVPAVLSLNQLITATPSSTFTPSPTFTPTFTPSNTPTFTRTFTPSSTPTATWTPTPSFTPSRTFTPTATYTSSDTPTPSSTPTASWTSSNTFTPKPSLTPTPTFTLTPSRTSTFTSTPRPTLTFSRTPTRTPSNTPSPQPVQCPGLLPSRLEIGMVGRVTPGSPNNLRAGPSRSADRLAQIPGGNAFIVVGGPVCDQYTWWEVEYNGIIGWTVEGSATEYYVDPVVDSSGENPSEDYGMYPRQCAQSLVTRITPDMRILTIQQVRLRDMPTSITGIALANGTDLLTLDTPVCAYLEGDSSKAELLWWHVRVLEGSLAGQEGWISESSLDGYNVDIDYTP